MSFTLDGNSIETAPSKGAYDVSVTCNNGAEGYWNYEEWGPQIKNITKKTKCSIAFTTGKHFSDYIISLSNSNVSNVEKIEHEATEQTPALTDYRYTGSNEEVNNYVYFGCSDNCTEDNLYRIIGVIPTQSSDTSPYKNRVKLIKANYYTENESGLLLASNGTYPPAGGSGYGYQWNSSANNKWEESTLQQNVLNGVYWNSLGEYQSYIEQAKWYLGAANYNNYTIYTPEGFYREERSNNPGKSGGLTSYINNIGLMYPSDYGYSIGSKNKNTSIYESKETYQTGAWLYNLENKYYEWSLTPEINNDYIRAMGIYPEGFWIEGSVYTSGNVWGIRPTFYLKENILYKSGDGSIANPYRIVL